MLLSDIQARMTVIETPGHTVPQLMGQLHLLILRRRKPEWVDSDKAVFTFLNRYGLPRPELKAVDSNALLFGKPVKTHQISHPFASFRG